jgi:hypothetical protein
MRKMMSIATQLYGAGFSLTSVSALTCFSTDEYCSMKILLSSQVNDTQSVPIYIAAVKADGTVKPFHKEKELFG